MYSWKTIKNNKTLLIIWNNLNKRPAGSFPYTHDPNNLQIISVFIDQNNNYWVKNVDIIFMITYVIIINVDNWAQDLFSMILF